MTESIGDKQLLRSVLDAARRTALNYRNTSYELYALGQLEATANLAYVLTMDQPDAQFESYCQEMAAEAVRRMAKLTSKPATELTARSA